MQHYCNPILNAVLAVLVLSDLLDVLDSRHDRLPDNFVQQDYVQQFVQSAPDLHTHVRDTTTTCF